MVIHINPNRINTPSGRPQVSRERSSSTEKKPSSPKQAHENFIPEPESLSTIIRNAISALRQGVHWDRGSILNLLV